MTIDKVLHVMGFECFVTEHGISVVGEGGERFFFGTICEQSGVTRGGQKRHKERFKVKDMGSAHFLLGVEFRRRLDGGYFMVEEK